MLDEVHDDKHPVEVAEVNSVRMQASQSVLSKCFADNHLTNAHNVVMAAQHEGIYFAKGGDGETVLLLIKL